MQLAGNELAGGASLAIQTALTGTAIKATNSLLNRKGGKKVKGRKPKRKKAYA